MQQRRTETPNRNATETQRKETPQKHNRETPQKRNTEAPPRNATEATQRNATDKHHRETPQIKHTETPQRNATQTRRTTQTNTPHMHHTKTPHKTQQKHRADAPQTNKQNKPWRSKCALQERTLIHEEPLQKTQNATAETGTHPQTNNPEMQLHKRYNTLSNAAFKNGHHQINESQTTQCENATGRNANIETQYKHKHHVNSLARSCTCSRWPPLRPTCRRCS